MAAMAQNQRDLAHIRQELPNAQESTAAPPLVPSPREPNVGIPERYDGDSTTCNALLCNSSIIFALQPITFASEEA